MLLSFICYAVEFLKIKSCVSLFVHFPGRTIERFCCIPMLAEPDHFVTQKIRILKMRRWSARFEFDKMLKLIFG